MRYEQYKHKGWVQVPEQLDDHPVVKGHDFSKKITVTTLLEGFAHTGMQATNLGRALEIIKQMEADKAKILLVFTGNAISSGLHDLITLLVKEKKVHGIITSGAGVEEDVIKSHLPFKLGTFEIPGRMLYDRGIGRIGNILVPLDRYTFLEKFMLPIFEQLNKKKIPVSPVECNKVLGEHLNEKSYLYWAAKHGIPVYSPSLIDGSIGDLAYFFKRNHPSFVIDALADTKRLVDFGLNNSPVGAVILGGGVSKHYVLNSMIFREGLDYAIYLTTAEEFTGSDSGGNPEEAITWAKLKVNAPYAKVKADFTITFPLLVASWLQE